VSASRRFVAASLAALTILLAAAGLEPARAAQARQDDGRRDEATRAFAEGERLSALATPDSARASIAQYARAAELCRELGDAQGQARALTNVGYLSMSLGDRLRALDALLQATRLWARVGVPKREAQTLRVLGSLSFALGDPERALDYFEAALPKARAASDRYEESVILSNTAHAFDSLGRFDEALAWYQQSLAATEKLEKPVDAGIGIVRNNIGHVYLGLGRPDEALTWFLAALPDMRPAGGVASEAQAVSNIGLAYAAKGDHARATEYFDRALPLAREAANGDVAAATLFRAATVERDRGELDAARLRVEAALAELESERSQLSGYEFRAFYFASKHEYYDLLVDVLMRLDAKEPGAGHAEAALYASERARARALLDAVVETPIDLEASAGPDAVARIRGLKERIDRLSQEFVLARGKDPRRSATGEEARALDRAIVEYRADLAILRRGAPDATRRGPEPLRLDALRSRVLDADTALVEYALGAERSYAWVVTRAGFATMRLPGRSAIEALVRRVRSFATARACAPRHETPAEASARIEAADRDFEAAAAELGHAVVEPVIRNLRVKRLAIVADGPLQFVPFAALPAPPSGPLLARYEIVLLPSASALAAQRERTANRPSAPKSVCVLADPVFEASDGRLARARAAQVVQEAPSARFDSLERIERHRAADAVCARQGALGRLPGSRAEARAILGLVPRSERKAALDFEASLETVADPAVRQYRILHIATHGVFQSQYPEFSGLVFSLYDEVGRPRDGFLGLPALERMSFPAELVTLSACDTALGRELRGEGLVGLARAFMAAGSRRVAATLWKIDDEPTVDLMAAFYREVLRGGKSPAAAMRAAQLELRRSGRWRAPYYWASFVVYGEWR
jgi:CHAT domain-containing protein/tetratricopeptide (TPR) repeat protein